MTLISTQIFEKVANENLSSFRETTPNQEFYGVKKVQNDAKERRKGQKRKESEKRL